ncbi:MAG TPA: VIT domain-containing protein [Gemmatimonadaceae bacterium]
MRASYMIALLTIPAALAAQGRMIPVCPVQPRDGPMVMTPCAAQIVRTQSDVRARLDGRVVRYEVEEQFVNRGARVGEADYLFPLPDGAAFRDLKLSINGQMVAGETMDASQARGVYEEIVRRMRDPALVEWMGAGLLRARIFPIAPGETKRVIVSYEAVVPREGDALRVDYTRPTNSAANTTYSLTYKRSDDLGTPYSPTNTLDTRDSSGFRVVSARGITGDVTVLLPMRVSDRASISTLTNASLSDGGFAMITISPPADHAAPSPRDVTFVVDVSGSMSGQKIEQARAAGEQLLATLRPQDRFRLIDFSSDVHEFRDGFVYANTDNINSARRYLDGLMASGGTNIAGALDAALQGEDAGADDGRLALVLFVTDGMPTVGEHDPAAIIARAERERGNRRLFTFGLGADVNSALLEQLALQGRGTAQFVRPDEDVERAVGIVASRLVDPVATDLRVHVEGSGVQLRDVTPAMPADLFAGQDLVVLARYTGDGNRRIVVEGRSHGRDIRWTSDAQFARDTRDNGFVPRLWAAQRIGYLSAERRQNGGSQELDQEIRSLGERYGIPTEFTSYLVQEPQQAAFQGVSRPMKDGVPLSGVVTMGVNAPAGFERRDVPMVAPASAGADFEAAKMASAQRAVKSLSALDSLSAVGGMLSGMSSGGGAQLVNGHTFALRDGRWVDIRWSDSTRTVHVQAFSKSYFALMQQIPELRAMAALGDRVVMAGRNVAIEIVPAAAELSDRELQSVVSAW